MSVMAVSGFDPLVDLSEYCNNIFVSLGDCVNGGLTRVPLLISSIYMDSREEGTAKPSSIVVVVNHCFTSLFGTNGILSDIVKRLKRCSQLMR